MGGLLMYFHLALRNLSRARIRSILAVIGIIIGVTAITSIGIFGDNLKRTVIENLGDIANELIIIPNASAGYTKIDEKVVETIKRSPFPGEVIPLKAGVYEIGSKETKMRVTVYGLDEKGVSTLFTVEKGSLSLKSGRCIVGSKIASRLDLRVGSRVTINGKIYRVSGILKDEGRRFDIRVNNAFIIPIKEHPANITNVIVKLRNIDDIEGFKDYIKKTVNVKREKVDIIEMKSILERIDKVFDQINMFLMAIAGISLLVAGVSILNIMLMSTIERTKEIGIMRAIGAQKPDILKIFLTEAGILGVSGSVVGAVLSIVGGYFITKLIIGQVSGIFSTASVLFAVEGFAFGVGTAIISGLYPAWRASNLEPIEALRYE